MPDKVRELNDGHKEAAGRMLRQIKNMDEADAQLTLVCVTMFICHSFKLYPQDVTEHLLSNIYSIAHKQPIVDDLLNKVHAEFTEKKIFTFDQPGPRLN